VRQKLVFNSGEFTLIDQSLSFIEMHQDCILTALLPFRVNRLPPALIVLSVCLISRFPPQAGMGHSAERLVETLIQITLENREILYLILVLPERDQLLVHGLLV
jgi:hypothetical protein